MPTADRLREVLRYEPDTGHFYFRSTTGRGRYRCGPGGLAGHVGKTGYRELHVDGKRYYAHRVAWLYTHGKWPEYEVDHINGRRDDNRLVNLREARRAEQRQNSKRHSNNTSGYTGVCWSTKERGWVARIHCARKQYRLGVFADPARAYAAYLAAKVRLHRFQPTPRDASSGGL